MLPLLTFFGTLFGNPWVWPGLGLLGICAISSGVSAASGLLGKPDVPEVSWELRSKVPLPKSEKSADLAHYFSGVTQFCV